MSKLMKIEFNIDTTNPEELSSIISVLQGFMSAGNIEVNGLEEVKEAPKKEAPKKEAPEKEAPKKEAAPEITIVDIRDLVRDKAVKYRAEIKDKLSELGAPNVTTLSKDKYAEFNEYLQDLE